MANYLNFTKTINFNFKGKMIKLNKECFFLMLQL